MRRSIAMRKAMCDISVDEKGPLVFECIWCGHRFDLARSYEPAYDVYLCPCCDAGHTAEGSHFILDRKGRRSLYHHHILRREGKLE